MKKSRGPVLIQACLNGATTRSAHFAVPLSATELAHDARRSLNAGAAGLHVHARLPDGSETLDPGTCASLLSALRGRCPSIPICLTTSASAEGDPARRLALISNWTAMPDFVSVNMHEEGSLELVAVLRKQGIRIEAGLRDVRTCEIFIESGLAAHCSHILVEPAEPEPNAASTTARTISQMLTDAGIMLPQLHHGEGLATWAVIEAALNAGHDIRIGLEDTTQRPDGAAVTSNAELVAIAVELVYRHGHRPCLPSRNPAGD
ncbi:MAG TPA: 3-keto-5-aminohexanoate cleavage protein [Chloroflexota bacterium]|nr:3-keto-5-aminohexanoate cleavage protein [Chloroflexota bacterium]